MLKGLIKGARFSPEFFVVLGSLVWFSLFAWRGLTIDEYTTWQNTRLSLSELIANRLRAGHMPTYFAIVHLLVQWLGDSEFALRFFSIVCAALSMGIFWSLAVTWTNRSIATFATLVLATNQVTVWCAQNARPYAGVLLCGIVLGWAITKYILTGLQRFLLATGLTVVVGLSLHAAFAMAVIAFILNVLVVFSLAPKQRMLLLLSLAIPLALMFVPLAVLGQHQQKFQVTVASPAELSLVRPLNLLARVVFGDYKLWGRGGMKFITLGLFAVLLIASRSCFCHLGSRHVALQRAWIAAIMWGSVPLAGLLLTEIVGRENVLSHPRYMVHALPAIALIVGAGANRLGELIRQSGLSLALSSIPLLLTLGLNLLGSLAWLRTNGDGPRAIAPLLVKDKVVSVLGTTSPLEYEWRRQNHPPLISLPGVPLSRLSADQQRKVVEEAKATILKELEAGAVWVFIYNNKTTTLDRAVEELSKGPVVTIKRLSNQDGRAFLLSKHLLLTGESKLAGMDGF